MSEDKGFEVHDKRKARFDAVDEATVRDTAPKSIENPDERAGEDISQDSGGNAHAYGRQPGEMPPIDFISFISSLAATALMHLGEKIAPDQPDMKDLPAARQMIDLIELLKEKTAGNLDKDETEIMRSILYNLHMRFVRESSGKQMP